MKQSEKDQLLSNLKSLITSWDTDWNNGRNQALKESIQLIEQMPVDPEVIPARDKTKTNVI